MFRESWRSPERLREAQREPEQPTKAQRDKERPREDQRDLERPRDAWRAQRGPENHDMAFSLTGRGNMPSQQPFPRQAGGKGNREHSQEALTYIFPRQGGGKGNRKGSKPASMISALGPPGGTLKAH